MPLLLVVIAAVGVYRSVTLDQSSWQGASFGMFATYDNVPSRTVVVRAIGPSGSARIAVPHDLQDDAVRLRVVPTDDRAAALARSLTGRTESAGATRIEVEVWRIALEDRDGLHLRLEPVARGAAAP